MRRPWRRVVALQRDSGWPRQDTRTTTRYPDKKEKGRCPRENPARHDRVDPVGQAVLGQAAGAEALVPLPEGERGVRLLAVS
jgi:hypothetical protein